MVVVHVFFIALPLGDDVVLAQVLFGGFAKGFFGFDFSVAELSAQLQTKPVFNPLRACTDFSSGVSGYRGVCENMEPTIGLEPMTCRLRKR